MVALLFTGCGSTSFYSLPALPFSIELPGSYGFLESESAYIFSGESTFVFEKASTELAFFQLFETGYEELTEKSQGVWVICAEGDWTNCYVQNMDFAELYPLQVRSEGALSEEARAEVQKVLHTLKKD